jgi:hypothetical protein
MLVKLFLDHKVQTKCDAKRSTTSARQQLVIVTGSLREVHKIALHRSDGVARSDDSIGEPLLRTEIG